MDLNQRKEVVLQHTLIALLVALVMFVAAFFISTISANTVSETFINDMANFYQHPFFWILIIFTLLMPISAWIFSKRLIHRIYLLQEHKMQEDIRVQQIDTFLQGLIQDDYETEYSLSGEHDSLGKKLVDLREKLSKNQEDLIKQREEENQRNWMAEGIAHFGDILRSHVDDLDKLTFTVLKDLTKYIDAIQGGFYTLDDTDPDKAFFNLTAFFAYDRKKFADQQIAWGDGLVGTCALEKKTIHMHKIPESYVHVTSGLGQTNPKSILLEPLLFEEKVFGILEFATLHSFQPHHLTLVKRIAGSIGSTLATMKKNRETSRLLEESNAQASMLASQEEEMRQNMEELKATQEEASRQSQQLMSLEENINQSLIKAEFDPEGSLTHANNLFLEKFQFNSNSDIEGKKIIDLVDKDHKTVFQSGWNEVLNGSGRFEGRIRYATRQGNELWISSTLSGIRENGSIEKIMFLAIDNTKELVEYKKLNSIASALQRVGPSIEMDIHGTIRFGNDHFVKLSGIPQKEFGSVSIFDIMDTVEIDNFAKTWDAINKGMDYEGQLKIRNKNGEDIWLVGTFTAVYDMNRQIDHIVFVGRDVTKEKELETDQRTLTDQLNKCKQQLREVEKASGKQIRELKSSLTQQYKELEVTALRNEALLEQATDAIVVTSSDNRIVFFNKAAEVLWKYSRSDVRQQHVGMLFSEKLIEKDEFLSSYTGPGDKKISDIRKKVNIMDMQGNKKTVLWTLSKAKIGQETMYIAFVQEHLQ